jgi:hypothetical protein
VKVAYLSAALDEHLAHVEYYDRCRSGLGAEYLTEISASIEQIVESSTRFPSAHSSAFQRCVMRRFPFSIVFLAQDDTIVIVAIAAQRRAPDYWLHR